MNSVGSQFTHAVKVWLRETAPLSFTHRALLRSVTQCSSNRAFSCTFPKAVRYYILKLFSFFPPFFSICPILHRPPKVHCWDQTFPHRECSCPSFVTPSSRPTSSSLHTLCKVLPVSQVSRSWPICSVFVLCHSVHIHFSPTLYAGLFQPSLATFSVRSVRRYTVCTKHGRSKLPFSVSAHFYSYYLLLYLFYVIYRLLQNPAAVAVAVVYSYR